MKHKLVIIVIVGIILAELILLTYVNANYYLRRGSYVFDWFKWFMWDYIIYIALNESVAFTVGILIFFKDNIRQSKKVLITTKILIFSLILLLASGIYFVVTLKTNVNNSNFIQYMDLYINVFYLVVVVSFIVFAIFSIIDKVVTKRLEILLLGLTILSFVVLYFRQNLEFNDNVFLANSNTQLAIKTVIDYIVVYPLNISIFIVFSIVLINDYKHLQAME